MSHLPAVRVVLLWTSRMTCRYIATGVHIHVLKGGWELPVQSFLQQLISCSQHCLSAQAALLVCSCWQCLRGQTCKQHLLPALPI